MSDRLFEQLQAQFWDCLRLAVERKRIATDRKIAAEQNAMREGTGLETILTDQKLELSRVEQKARVQEAEAAEDLRAKIGERQLELQRLQREVSQIFSDEALADLLEAQETQGFSLQEELRAISAECQAAPELDNRSVDEILGYGPDGSPCQA